MTPPPNPHLQQAANLLNQIDFKTDVKQAYARAANQLKESGSELFGADVPQEIRDQDRENKLFRLKLDEGRDLYNAHQAETNTRLGGTMALGAATAPQLVQTGGTTTTVQPMNWTGLLGPAATIATAPTTGGGSLVGM